MQLKIFYRARDGAQLIECSVAMHKALGLIPIVAYTRLSLHNCLPSIYGEWSKHIRSLIYPWLHI